MLLRKNLLLLGIIFFSLVFNAGSEAESSNQNLAAASEARASGEQKLPTLVDLGADKCIPCKMMAPILEELKTEYAGQMKVQFIDVWKDREKAKEYGVQMIPTQIFYDESGKELFRRAGFIGKEDILAKWRELGYEFRE